MRGAPLLGVSRVAELLGGSSPEVWQEQVCMRKCWDILQTSGWSVLRSRGFVASSSGALLEALVWSRGGEQASSRPQLSLNGDLTSAQSQPWAQA